MDERRLEDIRGRARVVVDIDGYGYQGEGYVRLADGWLSVPGALPGERVEVRVEEGNRRSRRVWAQVVKVLEASEHRRDPLCEAAGVCRGCQLRYVTVAEELRFHVRTVREVVEKFAGVPVSEQPPVGLVAPQPISRGDAYRIRSSLTYRRVGASCELGLVSPVSEGLVPMGSCPALTTPVRRLVDTVVGCFEGLGALPWDAQMAQEVGGHVDQFEPQPGLACVHVMSPVYGRGLVDMVLTGELSAEGFDSYLSAGPIVPVLERLEAALPDGVGLRVGSGEFRRLVKAPERTRLPLAGLRLEVGFEDWVPATVSPSDTLYEALEEVMALKPGEDFLDVGCGIGTISLLAAKVAGEVVGVDHNRESIATAEMNAVAHGAENVAFVAGGWERALRRLTLDERSFDVASINPMRAPLGRRALLYLEPLGVERLVYLAPSPASGAKDIGELVKMGWRLDRLDAVHLHPATYHTMLLARLRAT